MAAETAREMRDILESDLVGDFGHRAAPRRVGDENLIGALQAFGLHELADRRIVVVEQAVEIAQRNPAARGDLSRRKILVAEIAFR